MSLDAEESLHPIFIRDPEDWMHYVYKEVAITTEDGGEHVGWVYTVDPVTETFALYQPTLPKKLTILFGSSIVEVKILDSDVEKYRVKLDSLFQAEAITELSEKDLKQRLARLKTWLEKNRLPVDVSGDHGQFLTISDALTIKPPYDAASCVSTNEIILGRIQGLIKNMPVDQEDW